MLSSGFEFGWLDSNSFIKAFHFILCNKIKLRLERFEIADTTFFEVIVILLGAEECKLLFYFFTCQCLRCSSNSRDDHSQPDREGQDGSDNSHTARMRKLFHLDGPQQHQANYSTLRRLDFLFWTQSATEPEIAILTDDALQQAAPAYK